MLKVLAESRSLAVEASLADAQRKRFRLAVIGRTWALVPIALFYLTVYGYPNNVYIASVIFADIDGFTRLSEPLASAGER